jgi:methionyl-tRNA synthetase
MTIAKGTALFPKIEPARKQGEPRVNDQSPTQNPIEQGVQRQPAQTPPNPSSSPAASQITIEEFQKIQLKTAKVVTAERVPRSEKLIKLQIDLGGEQRQIVAGIGKTYEPDALVGRTIVVVANLKPAKLMGIESQGMVLAAGDKDVNGLVTILEDVAPGTKVK